MSNKIHELFTEEQHRILNNSTLPRYLKHKVKSIINCRTMNIGGRVYFCPDLHGGLILFNSCKLRGCPVCMETEQLKWFYKQKKGLLPVKHNHLVFKIPTEISNLWLYNKKILQTIIIDAAAYTAKKVNQDISLKRGWISVLHTAGSDLSYHPHLHTLITNGGFSAKQIWQENSIDIDSLQKYYQKNIKKKLLDALNKNKLYIPPDIDRQRIEEVIQNKEFKIKQAGTYTNGEGVLKYFSKKLKIGALNHKQIISYDAKTLTFYYKVGKKKEIVKLKREEFIRRYINHIPLKGFRIVRNYGLYSQRQIGQTKKLRVEQFGKLPEEPENISQIPKCPVCGKELSIVKIYTPKGFQELFKIIKKADLGRPPPGHNEFAMINS